MMPLPRFHYAMLLFSLTRDFEERATRRYAGCARRLLHDTPPP